MSLTPEDVADLMPSVHNLYWDAKANQWYCANDRDDKRCDWAATIDESALDTIEAAHEAHVATHIAALVTRREAEAVTTFIDGLPGDVFSPAVVGLLREWAAEVGTE